MTESWFDRFIIGSSKFCHWKWRGGGGGVLLFFSFFCHQRISQRAVQNSEEAMMRMGPIVSRVDPYLSF